MKKLLYSSLLLCAAFLPSCSTASDAAEDEPSYIGTTIRASAFFSEVGSTTQINELRVGNTYSVHFSPYCPQLFDKYKDFISGSVEKVTYHLDVPYKGVSVIGSSTTAPFTVQYTPADEGQCILTASFDLSPKDNNKWVEVESVVNVVAAE